MQGTFRPEVIEHIESRYGEVLIKEWMFTKALEDMDYNDLVLWGYESHQNAIKLSNNYNEISCLHSKLQHTLHSILDAKSIEEIKQLAYDALATDNDN